MWFVVHFTEENSVECVPQSWCNSEERLCSFPRNVSPTAFYNLIRGLQPAEKEWDCFEVKVLGKYDDFKVARRKAEKAKDSNYLTSQEEGLKSARIPRSGKRGIKRNRNFMDTYDISLNISSGEDNSNSDDSADSSKWPEAPYQKKLKANDRELHDISKPVGNPSRVLDLFDRPKTSPHTPRTANILDNIRSPQASSLLQTPRIPNIEANIRSQASPSHHTPRTTSDDEFQRQVLRELSLIKNILKQHSENFNTLLASSTQNVQPDAHREDLEALVKLWPLNVESIKIFEEQVHEQKDLQDLLVKELSRMGGGDAGNLTKRILYRVLTNDAGQLYSWEGAKGKMAFKKLTLSKIIINAVRANPGTTNATDIIIIQTIKKWLVKAKQREELKKKAD